MILLFFCVAFDSSKEACLLQAQRLLPLCATLAARLEWTESDAVERRPSVKR